MLKKTADLMRERADAIARTLTMEQGKPLAEAKARGAALGRHLRVVRRGGQARLRPGHPQLACPASGTSRIKHPVGVVGGHQPVELPDHAAGPQDRPGPGRRLHHRLQARQPDAAVPDPGLRVPGRGRPARRASPTSSSARPRRSPTSSSKTPSVRKISFTGSTEVGKQLMRGAADQMKRAQPGAGRPRPVHRLPRRRPGGRGEDRRHRASSATTARCASRRAASTSTRTSQKKFTEAAVEFAKALKLGNGLDAGVEVGPMFEKKAMEQTLGLVDDARRSAAPRC